MKKEIAIRILELLQHLKFDALNHKLEIGNCIKLLNDYVQNQNWKEVQKGEYPKEKGKYIVQVGNDTRISRWISVRQHEEYGICRSGYFEDSDVTHWMEIPEFEGTNDCLSSDMIREELRRNGIPTGPSEEAAFILGLKH